MIDLHSHSTASDGRLSPGLLVWRAKQLGLEALALTDHDTVSGLDAFHKAGQEQGLETISGIEVSAVWEKSVMHILGFFIRDDNPGFNDFIKKIADSRKVRNPKIVANLNRLGMKITMAEVEAEAGLRDDGPGGGAVDKSIGRPHIASILVRKGYVRNKQEAFDLYLDKGKPAFEDLYQAQPDETIGFIHAAKGVAVLAHPTYLRTESEEELDALVGRLKGYGLDGIEVHYSTHSGEQYQMCLRMAEKYNLLLSGGSDFHGDDGRGGNKVELGSGINGNLRIPYEILQKLKDRAAVV